MDYKEKDMITSNPNRKWLKPIQLLALLALYIGFLAFQAGAVFGAPSALPEISIGNATVVEGDSGTSTITFLLTRTGTDLSLPSAVTYTSVGDSAEEGVDYVGVSDAVAFGSNEVTKTIQIDVNSDLVIESDEEFLIALTAGPNATVGDGEGLGTIQNNDEAKVSLVADAEAFEADGVINFEVEISNPVAADVTVAFSTTDITTVFGEDIKIEVPSVTFPANTTANQIASVVINDESIVEADETFEVELGAVTASGLDVTASTDTVEGTVKNDDTATVVVDHPAEVYEGETVLYTASLSAPVDGGVTIDYETSNGAAGATADYLATDGTLAFTGSATQEITFTVDIVQDPRVENDENFFIDFSLVSAPTVANSDITPLASIESTIVNTDTSTVELIGGTTVEEGDSGTTDVSFTLSVGSFVKGGFSIPVIVTGETAEGSGIDFENASQIITFPQGDLTESFTVSIVGDDLVEGDETINVTLGDPVAPVVDDNAIIPTGTPQIITILNDDLATIELTNDPDEGEGIGDYEFKITVDKEVQDGFSISYATSDGTASSTEGDYVNLVDQLAFDGDANESKTVNVQIEQDTIVEANETFALNLLTVLDADNNDISDRFIFDTQTLTGTIRNDDTAQITLDFSPLDLVDGVVKAEEGNAGSQVFQARAILNSQVQGGLSIDYFLTGGTATPGTDYEATTGTLNFNGNLNGAEVKPFNITIYGDEAEEANETFIVSLEDISNTAVNPSTITIVSSPAIFEITNDDGTIVTVSADPSEVLENTESVDFTIELDNPSVQTVTVDYATLDDTALEDSDYEATSGSVTFDPGETIKTVSVSLIDNTLSEPNEIFFLQLTEADNATIGAEDKAPLTIIDDDGLPSVTLSSDSYQVAEGGPSVPVTLTLSRISSQPVSVLVSSTAGSAASPDDFDEVGTVVTFEPNQVTKTVLIAPKDDSVFERDEEFTIGLSNFVNSEAGEISEATITIVENDLAPLISIANQSISETNDISTMNFVVSLSEAAEVDISVSFETQDGTARVDDGDYVASAGRLVIPAGDLSAQIQITINGDNLGERNEFFRVILSAPSDNNLDPTAEGTIAVGTLENDDFFQVMLPVVTNGRINAPDLVPVKISVDGDDAVSITIQNRGNVAVDRGFWVDLFVDPSVLPTKPNHTTQTLREVGLIWFVSGQTLPINPGETITLRTNDSNFNPEFSDFTGTIPAGTLLVVHVDSADSATDYGAIRETHEQNNGIYNNILNSTTTREVLIR